MNRSIWQLTKRRWATVATEPGVYIAFAITVVGFAALGPFGTFSEMAVTERLGFWLLVHLVSWVAAIFLIVPARFTLEHLGMPVLPAFLIGTFFANLAISPFFIWVLAQNTNAHVTFPISVSLFIIVAFVITLITYIVLRFSQIEVIPTSWRRHRESPDEAASDPQTATATSEASAHILKKLPAEKRGTLFAMIAHDHYVEIVTERGRHLVLMRLSDAIALCDKIDGMKVHRSAWVSRAGMSGIIVKGRRMWITLPDGSMVAVSRQHQDDVRDHCAVGETVIAQPDAQLNLQ